MYHSDGTARTLIIAVPPLPLALCLHHTRTRPLLTAQLLESPKSGAYPKFNLRVSNILRTLTSFRSVCKTGPLIFNNLRTLIARSCQLFAPRIFCFQQYVDSFAQNRGGRGVSRIET